MEGLDNHMQRLTQPLVLMTDCRGLGWTGLSLEARGSGAEAPVWALTMLLQAIGKEHLVKHVFSGCSDMDAKCEFSGPPATMPPDPRSS